MILQGDKNNFVLFIKRIKNLQEQRQLILLEQHTCLYTANNSFI